MSDYTWPTAIVPSSSEWRLVANTAAFMSPLNGATRTLARGGDRWACTLTVNNLTSDNRAVLRAFLARLRGQAHRVTLPDHAYRKRGTLAVNPLVKGAGQTGTSLAVDNGTAAATLKAGDMLTVGGYLYMVATDTSFDGSAEASIEVTPALHGSPADNATVTVTAPTGRFLLASNTVGWSNIPGGISSFVLEFVEDIAV